MLDRSDKGCTCNGCHGLSARPAQAAKRSKKEHIEDAEGEDTPKPMEEDGQGALPSDEELKAAVLEHVKGVDTSSFTPRMLLKQLGAPGSRRDLGKRAGAHNCTCCSKFA